MEYKKSIIILILTIFLFSIASVCASDVNDTLAASEDASPIEVTQTEDVNEIDDNQAIGQSNDEEIISEGNVGTFSELQNNITAKYGSTLELDRNYEYDDSFDTSGIKIEQSITIDGKGHTIDAKGKSRVFNVKASDVTIKNLTIKNANNNANGGAIYFSQSAKVINCNFTNNSASDNGGAIYFYDTGEVTNCNFINNRLTAAYSYGGAVYFASYGSDHNVSNCNFTDNTAGYGGAIYFCSSGTTTNCNFTNNRATFIGGAVQFGVLGSNHNVTNCNFVNNTAPDDAGAIYMTSGTVTNSKFINNIGGRSGAILSYYWWTVTADTCIFKTASDSTYQVHILPPTLNVDNFTTVYNSGEKLTFELITNSSMPVEDGNISISVYNKNNDSWVGNYSCLSGQGWTVDLPAGSYYAIFNTEYAEFTPVNRTITIMGNSSVELLSTSIDYDSKSIPLKTEGVKDIHARIGETILTFENNTLKIPTTLGLGNYTLSLTTVPDECHYSISKTFDFTVVKANSTLKVDDITFDYGSSGTTIAVVIGVKNITAKVVGHDEATVKVKLNMITVSNLNAGTYKLEVTTIPDVFHNSVTKTAKVTVNKLKTQITASAVSTTYGKSKNLVITLKDSNGNPLSNVKITVKMKSSKKYTTDKNGQIKVAVGSLVPKKYNAKITFNGNTNYAKSTKSVKVTVKKAASKITAKKKTFKKSKKTKKYSITLKANKKAIKKVKVTLKVNKKTYKAKTNSKGKATFKITKLTKKGKFTTKIKFNGNKYYKATSKKVKIKVK